MILFEQQLHSNPLIMQHEHKGMYGGNWGWWSVYRNKRIQTWTEIQSLPPQCTIGIFCISLDDGLFSHFHELHGEINSLKTVSRYQHTSWDIVLLTGENPIGTCDWFPLLISRLSHPLVETTHFYLDDVSISQSETEFRLIGYKFPILCACFEINLYILSFLRPAVTSFTCLQDFFL